MRKLLLSFILLSALSFHSEAAQKMGFSGCGTYKFQGTPRIIKSKMILVINEKTLSEIIFSIPPAEQANLAPYINLVTKGEFTIARAAEHMEATNLKNLSYSTPDPLNNTKHSYFQLEKKENCR